MTLRRSTNEGIRCSLSSSSVGHARGIVYSLITRAEELLDYFHIHKRLHPCVLLESWLSFRKGRRAVPRRSAARHAGPVGSNPLRLLSTTSPVMCEAVSRWPRTRSC